MSLPAYQHHIDLRNLLKKAGCFEPQAGFYTCRLATLGAFLILSILFLVFSDIFYLQILNAVFLAFLFGQMSLTAHDIVHRQAWENGIVDIVVGNFILGISCSWWRNKHNKKHHGYTNRLGLDADLDAPLLALTEEQISDKGSFEKFMLRYQAYYFFLVLLFVPLYMHLESFYFLIFNKAKYRLLEAICFVLHFALLAFFLSISQMNFTQIAIFLCIFKGVLGLYLGSIFIVNHTGMKILHQDDKMDYFLSQIITSRNIKPHPFVDFMMGGLNAQIEHHLFPQMPRAKLKESRSIVKLFCNNYDIPYHETSFVQAYQETLTSLHSIGSLSVLK